MSNPHLTIDLPKITWNARRTADLARQAGIEVMGVTKGVAGDPEVAKAMLAGGLSCLGDSRLDNIARMRSDRIKAPITLLRSPGPSDIVRTLELADSSLNSDVGIIEALSDHALLRQKVHGIILMADLGTGREGLPPDQLPSICRRIRPLAGIRLIGIGAYYHLGSARELHQKGLESFVAASRSIERELGEPLPVLSGGSSNIFRTLMIDGHPNPGVNQLRVGTAVLLGFRSSLDPVALPGYERDTFLLEAELIEKKPGGSGRAILALGKVDTDPQFLFPMDPSVRILDASSDHLVIGAPSTANVGDLVSFRVGYPALCRIMSSRYVEIVYRKSSEPPK